MIRRIATVLAAASVATVLGTTWASAATYGQPATVAAETKATFKQTTGDCAIQAFNLIYATYHGGARMKEATANKEAIKLGVLNKVTTDGSNWWAIPVLAAHYGIKATVGSHTLKTVEADLAAGDRVEAFVQAETLWATLSPNLLFGPPTAAMVAQGEVWESVTPGTVADHALVVDSIDTTAKTVTVSDTGAGLTYAVSIAVFERAMTPSGFSYNVFLPHGTK